MEIMELERKKRTTTSNTTNNNNDNNKTTLKKSCLLVSAVNMRLLAFLLIITEIFILFNSVVYGSSGDRKRDDSQERHWPPPSSSSSSSVLLVNHSTPNRQDNIQLKEFPRYNDDDQKQMIREESSGIEIATTYAPPEPETSPTKPNVPASAPLEGHQIIELGLFSESPLSSSSSSSELKNKELDRYHHSSGLSIRRQLAEADVNVALAVAAARESNASVSAKEAAGWRKSNPLIEQQQHTRTKRALDNDDASASSPIATQDPGEINRNSNNGDNRNEEQEVNGRPKELAPSEYRRRVHLAKDKYLSGSKNIRPHSGAENHYQGFASRFRNKNGLCHRDCSHVVNGRRVLNGGQQPNRKPETDDDSSSSGSGGGGTSNNSINGLETPSHSYRICGSDGQLYNSMCELRLRACHQNLHLFRVPRFFCAKQPEQPTKLDSQPASGEPSETNQMVDLQKYINNNNHNNNNSNNGSEEVRIVELKRRCNLIAYNEMKLLLIREFNGDVSSMFNYFDTNGDNYIEAHELWPRQADGTNKLRYAQLWDEHSSKCRKSSSSSSSRLSIQGINHHSFHLISHKTRPSHLKKDEDQTKYCWFFLDFAFEPQFAPNPCSLSHLMLFDLKHPNNRFDLETFKSAFEEPRALWANENEIKEEKQQDSSKHSIRQVNYSSIINGDKSNPKPTTTTRVQIVLGDSLSLGCLVSRTGQSEKDGRNGSINESEGLDDGVRCLWTRYNLNLGALQDPHIHVEKRLTQRNGKKFRDLMLGLKDAQLYLSGHYKCACYSKKFERTFEHQYFVQVSAEPRVNVRPQFQWSLPGSRISFECHYDYIDTNDDDDYEEDCDDDKSGETEGRKDERQFVGNTKLRDGNEDVVALGERGQFGLRVKWLKDNSELMVDSENFNGLRNQTSNNGTATTIVSTGGDSDDDDSFYSETDNSSFEAASSSSSSSSSYPHGDNNDNDENSNNKRRQQSNAKASYSFRQASITMAASRLTLENLTLNDSGQHTCRVEVPNRSRRDSGHSIFPYANHHHHHHQHETSNDYNNPGVEIFGSSDGTLLVQEQPKTDQSGQMDDLYRTYLWMFHDNGISIYKLQNDDGQEMELLREINGHSLVSGEVEGNWNQLTLCGGLNPEQVVICEWSDNALHIDVKHKVDSKHTRRYIYVGQPNLNRIIVIDGVKFEIVAIINTEPQPRKLYLYKPSRIHLSKWVRRRLSPAANARWLAAIGTYAHSLKSTPETRLYSVESIATNSFRMSTLSRQQRHSAASSTTTTNQRPSPLIQHDIWLLCYGQPLVVDPSGDEHLEEDEEASRFYSTTRFGSESVQQLRSSSNNITSNDGHNNKGLGGGLQRSNSVVQPFTPRLTAGGGPFGWPTDIWRPNKESKLRNRKSVHIIQSTFFPLSTLVSSAGDSLHNHHNENDDGEEEEEEQESGEGEASSASRSRTNRTVVGDFKRSTVLTTHHVFSGILSHTGGAASGATGKQQPQLYLARSQFDLIEDLHVPPKPYSLELNDKHKTHYAYVTHYNDQRLFRVSMDEYRYDREIDLQNCDPINLVTTAQGLLVVQCRAPITHQLIGQMVLDQLTSSRIEFNVNIKAQESYLSPDHRYLVSIFNNSTQPAAAAAPDANANSAAHIMSTTSTNHIIDQKSNGRSSSSPYSTESFNETTTNSGSGSNSSSGGSSSSSKRQSIIYVQTVQVSGLKLQYEIKTSLEISQCSFVWKDGYYAAIFVSTNRRDDQSEILSLRLADSRLQLMARVPGLISVSRHKDQLIVSPELRLAALSTNQGSYVVDLEDNRVSQSLRHHQSPPTLLWV